MIGENICSYLPPPPLPPRKNATLCVYYIILIKLKITQSYYTRHAHAPYEIGRDFPDFPSSLQLAKNFLYPTIWSALKVASYGICETRTIASVNLFCSSGCRRTYLYVSASATISLRPFPIHTNIKGNDKGFWKTV